MAWAPGNPLGGSYVWWKNWPDGVAPDSCRCTSNLRTEQAGRFGQRLGRGHQEFQVVCKRRRRGRREEILVTLSVARAPSPAYRQSYLLSDSTRLSLSRRYTNATGSP